MKRPSEISLRLRFSTQQNQGERLLPGNLGGEADRLVLAGSASSGAVPKADARYCGGRINGRFMAPCANWNYRPRAVLRQSARKQTTAQSTQLCDCAAAWDRSRRALRPAVCRRNLPVDPDQPIQNTLLGRVESTFLRWVTGRPSCRRHSLRRLLPWGDERDRLRQSMAARKRAVNHDPLHGAT